MAHKLTVTGAPGGFTAACDACAVTIAPATGTTWPGTARKAIRAAYEAHKAA